MIQVRGTVAVLVTHTARVEHSYRPKWVMLSFPHACQEGLHLGKHLLHVLHVRYIVNFDLITHRLTQLHSNCQSTFITVKKKKTQCLEK